MPNEKPSFPETTDEKKKSVRNDPSNLELPKILDSLSKKFPYLRDPLKRSASFIENLMSEADRLDTAYHRELVDVEQSLGPVLGYPWYKDDPEIFPGATEEDGVCVGEHTPGTLAQEAASKIRCWRNFVWSAALHMTLQEELIKVLNQITQYHQQGRFTRQSYERLRHRERELVKQLETNKKELDPLLTELRETHESYAELQKGRDRKKDPKGKGPGDDVQGAPI